MSEFSPISRPPWTALLVALGAASRKAATRLIASNRQPVVARAGSRRELNIYMKKAKKLIKPREGAQKSTTPTGTGTGTGPGTGQGPTDDLRSRPVDPHSRATRPTGNNPHALPALPPRCVLCARHPEQSVVDYKGSVCECSVVACAISSFQKIRVFFFYM